MALRTLSLCTGEAGIELGLHVAGIECAAICYVECEAYAAANLARLIDAGALPDAPFRSDVRTLCDADFRAFMEGIELDLLCGGYPCQPFSVAGRQRGADDPRHLWPWIAQAIGAYRPAVCFFENVPAHLKLGYPEVRADLRGMGYRVTEGLFTAGEVGAGHRRERLFILAVADTELAGTWDQRGPTGWGAGGAMLRQGHGETGSGGSDAAGTNVRCEELADASDAMHARKWDAQKSYEGLRNVWDRGVRRAQGKPRGSGGDVADAECPRCRQVEQQADWSSEANEPKRGRSMSVFPPGPGELEQWAGILAHHPHLAPAIEPGFCGVADGLSLDVGRHRSHQLRLHGNAVVPLVAAHAWIFLWADLLYGTGGR